eukprot:CAMPEP_0172575876 /NCGR_PEP_ID=MMETSP1067-20121228/137435_1 /TAXON_ID=265564 ORGANISM="Thalassiosira punctigera, Strain Tpunct2005C2" /NCGR_SAMPLE_ID=MMETSP1067 /ASSEMBLY_ACC=CAM_ASM_000444 /LENGTH=563 /DNA_ID=CAMNT_0013368531 /DNA_START=115 /DNA_END=1806 /DNA_ORIENTATION=-
MSGEGGRGDAKGNEVKDGSGGDGKNDDLIGATVRVKSGKYEGLTGSVKEIRRFRHVVIDASPPVFGPVDISHVRLLSHGEDADPESSDPAEKYAGAKVVVTEPHERAGAEGKVQKVLVGVWYVTDNREISSAYRAEKFEVVRYADAAPAAAVSGGKRSRDDGGEETGGRRTKRREEGAGDATAKGEGRGGTRGGEREESRAERNEDGAREDLAGPSALAEGEQEGGEKTAEVEPRRDILGALVRVNSGEYRGLEGVVCDMKRERRLEIDALPGRRLNFSDVRLLRHPDGRRASSSFFSVDRDYVGARVRIASPGEHEGAEGTVTRTIVVGEWYMTDSPDIHEALPFEKFDVIRYASDDDDDDDESYPEDVSATEGGNVEEEWPSKPHPQPMSFLDAIYNKRTVSLKVSPDECADDCCAPMDDFDNLDDASWEGNDQDEAYQGDKYQDEDYQGEEYQDGEYRDDEYREDDEEYRPRPHQPPSLLDAIYNKRKISMSFPPDGCAEDCCVPVNADEYDDDDYDENLDDYDDDRASWDGVSDEAESDAVVKSSSEKDEEKKRPAQPL